MSKELEEHYKKARVVKQTRCPKCEQEGKDRSGDNATHYEDGGIFCWARHGCIKMSDTYKKKLNQAIEYKEDIDMGNDFSPEYWDNLVANTTPDPRGYRGLYKDTCEKYGVMHEMDPETGKVKFQ